MSATYEVGDTLTYRAFGGEFRVVKVTGKYVEIKNAQPGFEGVLVDETGQPQRGSRSAEALGYDDDLTHVWGYDDQVERVMGR